MRILRISQPSRHKDLLTFLFCFSLAVVLLLLPDTVQIRVTERIRFVVTAPYWQVRNFGEDVIRLRRQTDQLRAQVAEMELQLAASDRQRRDRTTVEPASALSAGFAGRLWPCEVVARTRGRFARMIKIRSTEPVAWSLYQPVLTPEGLLGRVARITGPRSAWVELLSAPDVAVGCELERTRLLGVLRPGSGRYVLDMVGRDEDVRQGDKIITSGIAEVRAADPLESGYARMPRGLPVGTVSAVGRPADDELFKQIIVAPYATFEYNETVFVVGPELAGAGERSEAGPQAQVLRWWRWIVRQFVRTTVAWLAMAFLGDTLIAPMISIAGIAPDFSIIALVILALAEGPAAGSLGGFCLGLVQDLATPNLLGLRALCKTLVGFAAGRLRGRLVYGLPVVEGLVVALAVLTHDILFLLVQSRLSAESFIQPLFTQAVPIALYSALVGIPLLRLVDLLGILRRDE